MEIDGIEKLRAELPDTALSRFRVVRSLRYWCEEHGAMLTLEMISTWVQPHQVLRMQFSGVVDLRLKHFGGTETSITGFAVDDIRDKGWEGLFWEVLDFEDDKLHFYAKTAEILAVEAENSPPDTAPT